MSQAFKRKLPEREGEEGGAAEPAGAGAGSRCKGRGVRWPEGTAGAVPGGVRAVAPAARCRAAVTSRGRPVTCRGGAVPPPAGTMLSRLQELRREEETLLRVKAALHDQLRRLRVRGDGPGLGEGRGEGSRQRRGRGGGAGPAPQPCPRKAAALRHRPGPPPAWGWERESGESLRGFGWAGKGEATHGALRGGVQLWEVNDVCRVHLK